jgi:hypothetical protein
VPAELDQLAAYGAELVAACVAQVESLSVTRFGPVNASGRLKRELRSEATEIPGGFRLQLLAPGYVLTLLFGRQPGRFPNLTGIKQWIAVKGIVPHPDKNGRAVSVDSLAYLIGRKIAQQGNTVHQQGPPSQLFASILDPLEVAAALKAQLVPLLLGNVVNVLQLAA